VQTKLRNRVRAKRRERGLSQRQLVERASIARQTLVVLERDNGYEPTAAVMTALCDALGDTALFWWESEPAAGRVEAAS
jgi:transcriptional regulator with XRE-family HTH domain